MVVLRVDSTQLYDRLKARFVLNVAATKKTRLISIRDYPEVKLQENLDTEIMEVLLQEARDSYDEEIIVELTSNTSDEMESNIERIEAWLKEWKKNNVGADAS